MVAARVKVPGVLNAASILELNHDIERAHSSRPERVIILQGSADCFSRGMELGAASTAREEDIAGFARCLESIRTGPKPVIAAVQGPTTAGGVGLAAAADLVIAAPGATFGLTELLFGLLPAIVLPYLLERLSPSRARLWALSGKTWPAAEAQSAGLVDVVAPGTDLEALLNSWTRCLCCAQAAAIGLWKRHTAEARTFDSSRDVAITAGRLRDAQVLARIRRFAEDEELPWM